MSATIKFISPKFHAGALKVAGDTLTTDAATAAMYVSEACAVYTAREALAKDKGSPVYATQSAAGGVGFNGTIVDMNETPTDTNTATYPTGTLFISPEA